MDFHQKPVAAVLTGVALSAFAAVVLNSHTTVSGYLAAQNDSVASEANTVSFATPERENTASKVLVSK